MILRTVLFAVLARAATGHDASRRMMAEIFTKFAGEVRKNQEKFIAKNVIVFDVLIAGDPRHLASLRFFGVSSRDRKLPDPAVATCYHDFLANAPSSPLRSATPSSRRQLDRSLSPRYGTPTCRVSLAMCRDQYPLRLIFRSRTRDWIRP